MREVIYGCLQGRHIVITGGASGIGKALVEGFIGQGARVSFLDVDASASESVIAQHEDELIYFERCDVRDIDKLRKLLARLEGIAPIDVLVNNAGNDQRQDFFKLEPGEWDSSQNSNLRHHFFATQAVAKYMRERGTGVIISMGSVSWMRGRPGMAGYTTAKAAIHGFTRTAARELGEFGIRVNSIVPGAIQTEKQERLWVTPEARAKFLADQALKFRLQPEHVVSMALFLASDESVGCTGQAFIVDAGITLN